MSWYFGDVLSDDLVRLETPVTPGVPAPPEARPQHYRLRWLCEDARGQRRVPNAPVPPFPPASVKDSNACARPFALLPSPPKKRRAKRVRSKNDASPPLPLPHERGTKLERKPVHKRGALSEPCGGPSSPQENALPPGLALATSYEQSDLGAFWRPATSTAPSLRVEPGAAVASPAPELSSPTLAFGGMPIWSPSPSPGPSSRAASPCSNLADTACTGTAASSPCFSLAASSSSLAPYGPSNCRSFIASDHIKAVAEGSQSVLHSAGQKVILQFVAQYEPALMASIGYVLSSPKTFEQPGEEPKREVESEGGGGGRTGWSFGSGTDRTLVAEDTVTSTLDFVMNSHLSFRDQSRDFMSCFDDIDTIDELGPEFRRLADVLHAMRIRTQPSRNLALRAAREELIRQQMCVDLVKEERTTLARLQEIKEEKTRAREAAEHKVSRGVDPSQLRLRIALRPNGGSGAGSGAGLAPHRAEAEKDNTLNDAVPACTTAVGAYVATRGVEDSCKHDAVSAPAHAVASLADSARAVVGPRATATAAGVSLGESGSSNDNARVKTVGSPCAIFPHDVTSDIMARMPSPVSPLQAARPGCVFVSALGSRPLPTTRQAKMDVDPGAHYGRENWTVREFSERAATDAQFQGVSVAVAADGNDDELEVETALSTENCKGVDSRTDTES